MYLLLLCGQRPALPPWLVVPIHSAEPTKGLASQGQPAVVATTPAKDGRVPKAPESTRMGI